MIGAVIGDLWPLLVGLVGGAAALLAAWAKGKRDGRQSAEKQALEDYQRTRKAMDDAARDLPDDDGVLRDFLRERGRKP